MNKLFLVLIVSILLMCNAYAFTSLNVYVDNTGKAVFLGETDQNITLPDWLQLNDGQITGSTYLLTSKQADVWEFSYNQTGTDITVILPRGAVIKQLISGDLSLNGDQIEIFSPNSVRVKYTIEPVSSSGFGSNKIILAVVLAGAFVILLSYLLNYSRKEKKPKKIPRIRKVGQSRMDIIKEVLPEKERLILDKLKKYGKIKSSILRKACEIPKASFSRHVQELEKKGLIKRTGEGRNKFIELNRK